MSNITVFNPSSSVPAYAQATKGQLSSVALALAGNTNTGKRISIKGGVFRLVTGGKEVAAIEDRHLDVVIVAAAPKVSRTFYGVKYEEGQATAPTCWSADGDKPDASVKAKCAPTCAACPNNVAGSGQGTSRACSFSQRVAVVLANDIEGDVLQLTLPAQSIFGKGEGDNRPLQEYARYYAAQGHDISKFITRMKFDTAAAVPKLFFKAMRWQSDEEFAITSEAGKSADAIKAITMTVSQTDGVAPAVAAPAPLDLPGKPPKAAPAPQVEDDEPPVAPPKAAKSAKAKPAPKEYDNGGGEEATPEPEVKKAAPKAAAAPGAGLQGVLADWDDEE